MLNPAVALLAGQAGEHHHAGSDIRHIERIDVDCGLSGDLLERSASGEKRDEAVVDGFCRRQPVWRQRRS